MMSKKAGYDRKFLARAINLAVEGIKKGGGPFGAMITKEGRVLSEAYNEVVFTVDPTAHAEILAIRKACEIKGTHDLSDCTIYTSCEPCPMCLGAIYWAGIKNVVYGADRYDAAKAGFRDESLYLEFQKSSVARKVKLKRITGLNEDEPFRIWENFEHKTPY
jgi:guanine deaminase